MPTDLTTEPQTTSNFPIPALQARPTATDILATVLESAISARATDVHVDSATDEIIVRFRIDGVIRIAASLDRSDGRRLLNQIKVTAQYTPEATRTLQQGTFRWTDGEETRHVRLTLVPEAPDNESAHLRLLTPPSGWPSTGELGLPVESQVELRRRVGELHGLILIAGPTGAGKTTTLHALLETVDARRHVLASIEDPAEFDMPLVRQVQVDARRGVSMEDGLRALLRMDPDVISIGEIRDRTSAMIAARAALSGRLALATIHARDPASTIQAMHNLGVSLPVIAASLRAIVSQNLVRKPCDACVTRRDIQPDEAELFRRFGAQPPITVPVTNGCARCGDEGYRGRTGVFELACLDDPHGELLEDNVTVATFARRCRTLGATQVQDALAKVATGATTLDETRRILGSTRLGGSDRLAADGAPGAAATEVVSATA